MILSYIYDEDILRFCLLPFADFWIMNQFLDHFQIFETH